MGLRNQKIEVAALCFVSNKRDFNSEVPAEQLTLPRLVTLERGGSGASLEAVLDSIILLAGSGQVQKGGLKTS